MRNKLGTHVDHDNGVIGAVTQANDMGLDAFQFYLYARAQSWWPRKVDDDTAKQFRDLKGSMWCSVHAPFVINILTDPSGYRYANHSWKSLVYHMERSELLGIEAVVFHMGSAGEQGPDKGYHYALWYLTQVFLNYHGPVKLCIENDANPKKDPAGDFTAIIGIIDKMDQPNLRMCLDVTHTYAYGWDIRDSDKLRILLERVGSYVEMVHYNQPRAEVTCGSARDRHSDAIDKGALGIGPMKQVWHAFRNKPLIIEGTADFEYDREIIKTFEGSLS